jgi:hypothetical protein
VYSKRERIEMDKPRVLIGWPEQVVDPESVVEWNEADIQRSADVAVPVCGCGCGGICGNEQELDDGAEEEWDGDVGEPGYELTSAQIDELIEWMMGYAHERLKKGKNQQDEDQLEFAFCMLSDQCFHCKMGKEQRTRFEEACLCVSEIGWPWDDVIQAYRGGE